MMFCQRTSLRYHSLNQGDNTTYAQTSGLPSVNARYKSQLLPHSLTSPSLKILYKSFHLLPILPWHYQKHQALPVMLMNYWWWRIYHIAVEIRITSRQIWKWISVLILSNYSEKSIYTTSLSMFKPGVARHFCLRAKFQKQILPRAAHLTKFD